MTETFKCAGLAASGAVLLLAVTFWMLLIY